MTPSLMDGFTNLHFDQSQTDFDGAFQAVGEEAQHLVAPSAKRPRGPSFTLSIKKQRESSDLSDVMGQHWMMAPAIAGKNMPSDLADGSWAQNSTTENNLTLPFDIHAYNFDQYLLNENLYGMNMTTTPDLGVVNQSAESSHPRRTNTAPPSLRSLRKASLASSSGDGPISRFASPSLSESGMNSPNKRFKCPKPFCSKVYKNTNGLKYHLERGNCEMDDGDLNDIDDSIPDEVKVARRPYWCKACHRRYKNLNGLKYHARNCHPELDFRTQIKGSVGQLPPGYKPYEDEDDDADVY